MVHSGLDSSWFTSGTRSSMEWICWAERGTMGDGWRTQIPVEANEQWWGWGWMMAEKAGNNPIFFVWKAKKIPNVQVWVTLHLHAIIDPEALVVLWGSKVRILDHFCVFLNVSYCSVNEWSEKRMWSVLIDPYFWFKMINFSGNG